jgi:chitosanase
MKKNIVLLIVLISVLSMFTGCKSGNTASTPINITNPADVNKTTDTDTEPADKTAIENTTNSTDTAHETTDDSKVTYNGKTVTSEIKGVCLQLTTACENSSETFDYNYAEKIGDGRGITFGAVGFTTGTYDGNELIKYYTQLNPNNSLAKYIPALDKIDTGKRDSEGKSDDTTGLENFISDVQACSDPLFKQAQMVELDIHYWNPAVKIADSIGAKNNLTLAFIYDICVNHGADGAQDYVDSIKEYLGGTPASGVDENEFLAALMDYRYDDLAEDDPDSIDRVNAYQELLEAGNFNLKAPFEFTVYGDTFKIDGNVY